MVRVVLGLLLLAAAGLKLHELLTAPAAEQGPFASRWFRAAQVEVELLLGLWLLSGLFPRAAWGAALACFTGFGAVAAYLAFTGAESCGCFGRLLVDPMWTFALDAAAVAALVLCRPQDHLDLTGRPGRRRVAFFALAGIAVAGSAAAAIVVRRPVALPADDVTFPDGPLVLIDPAPWTGKRFPLLRHIDVGNQLAKGRWTVILYDPNCAKCRRNLPQYQQWARDRAADPSAPRVALIEMPPYAVRPEWRASPDSPALLGKLDESKDWVATTPLEISLADGVVQPASR